MRILITGGTGFIGSHLANALRARGHAVVSASRSPLAGIEHIPADFTRDVSAAVWLDRLRNVNIVINAVGILREHGEQTFDAVHTHAPAALFTAAAASGVARVIQISALGADTGTSAYFRSKHLADEALTRLPVSWTVVQPSLVYGDGGTSAALFTLMASLPVMVLPGRGAQRVQPVHIDDVVAAIVALCESDAYRRERVALVGPHAVTFTAMLQELRRTLGLGETVKLRVPLPLVRIAAALAAWHPRSLLDADTVSMLETGNTADPESTRQLLAREPRAVATFIRPEQREALLVQAQLRWLLPLLRLSIAVMWIWTAIVSIWLYPQSASFALLERTGVPRYWTPLMLHGAAALDFALGLATLLGLRARTLWLAQIALIVFYTVIISVRLPEFWLHPYGPILKNLPLLAALYLLYVFERPRWNT
jgi:uncharacterized protein YbjT (DUF2867 family)